MLLATDCLLFVTLALCGAYAGMALMCHIGVLPAMQDLSPRSFADAWRAMDAYMDKLMPPYKGALLLATLATLVLLVAQRRTVLACCILISLFLSVAGLVATIRGQLPLNAEIKKADVAEPRLVEIRTRTVAGFRTRTVLAMFAFFSICFGVIFWPLP